MRADVHMHTNFSHDSEALPEEMIQGAIQKGLEMLCITDHFDKDNMEWGAEDIFDPEAYFQVLRPLQEKYRGKIRVNIGVEIRDAPYLAPFYQEFVEKYPFDFVIGSVHSIWEAGHCCGQCVRGTNGRRSVPGDIRGDAGRCPPA